LTRINDIYLTNIQVDSAKAIYELRGDERLPIRNVVMKNISVGCVADTANGVKNVEALTVEDVTYNSVDAKALPQLDRYLSNK
ncbi:MAG: glycoside hydrolase family 28 protein, partial [Bacteroidaceae bacterium]|nr:glycoside hydrolase family 28 protein [Bacteroidaceae bacterium]